MKARLFITWVAVFMLAACTNQAFDGEYTWRKSGRPAAERYEWYQVSNPHTDAGCKPDSVGCSVILLGTTSGKRTCLVYSYYSESDARLLFIGQSRISHFDHEVGEGSKDGQVNVSASKGHCAGNVHEERGTEAT